MAEGTRNHETRKELEKRSDAKFDSLDEKVESLNEKVEQKFEQLMLAINELRGNAGKGVEMSSTNNNGGERVLAPLPGARLGKFDFPHFDGDDVDGWLFRCNQIFEIDEVPDGRKIQLVGWNMEGPAILWNKKFMRDYFRRDRLTWKDYCYNITNHFGKGQRDSSKELSNLEHKEAGADKPRILEHTGIFGFNNPEVNCSPPFPTMNKGPELCSEFSKINKKVSISPTEEAFNKPNPESSYIKIGDGSVARTVEWSTELLGEVELAVEGDESDMLREKQQLLDDKGDRDEVNKWAFESERKPQMESQVVISHEGHQTAEGCYGDENLGASLSSTDIGNMLRASYIQYIEQLRKVVAVGELTSKVSTNENNFTFEGSYVVDIRALVKMKINNQGRLGTLLQHEIIEKSLMTVSRNHNPIIRLVEDVTGGRWKLFVGMEHMTVVTLALSCTNVSQGLQERAVVDEAIWTVYIKEEYIMFRRSTMFPSGQG